jgi:hypothetical protein
MNEALAEDYVMPVRIVTPDMGARGGFGSDGDPVLQGADFTKFTPKILEMFEEVRRDPNMWHVLPFPLKYQALGGDAKSLAPKDLLDQGQDELLNGMGFPSSLYRFDLQLQVMPAALRLFQASWPQIVTNFNAWLTWMTTQVCIGFNWKIPEEIKLQPSTLADDVELRQIQLQLASAKLISSQTALSAYGLDARREQQKVLREQADFQIEQQKVQEDQANRQQMTQQMAGQPTGQPASMGGPSGASESGMSTPTSVVEEAQDLAQQWSQMDPNSRRKAMMAVKASRPDLHALASAEWDSIRQQAASQGQQQVMQQGGPQ